MSNLSLEQTGIIYKKVISEVLHQLRTDKALENKLPREALDYLEIVSIYIFYILTRT